MIKSSKKTQETLVVTETPSFTLNIYLYVPKQNETFETHICKMIHAVIENVA